MNAEIVSRDLEQLSSAVSAGRRQDSTRITRNLLDSGVHPQRILEDALIPGITVVGERFRDSKCFVPEVLIAARTLRDALDLLRPRFAGGEIPSRGTLVIGTVCGDLHDIGKNLVAIMAQGAGFRVIDLGVDVPPQKFAAAVRQHSANIVGISALLTTTMQNIRDTIRVIEEAGLRDQVKVIVGGAPLTSESAQEYGADAFARDAVSAAEVCTHLMEVPR